MRKLSNEREASLLIIHHIIWTQKTLVFLILCWPVCVYIQCAISSLETDCRLDLSIDYIDDIAGLAADLVDLNGLDEIDV